MQEQTNSIQWIALKHLVRSSLNVRKQTTNVTELAILIDAQGLLQNMIGFPQTKKNKETGKIEIVAGGRRLEALGILLSEGKVSADDLFPVKIVTRPQAVIVSMTENSGRVGNHPADECDAFHELVVNEKMTPEDVAAKFGITVATVNRRLKLAVIAPSILDEFRNGKASLEQMMAIALADDQATQLRVWKQLGTNGRSPYNIKNLIAKDEINTDHKLVKYVTLAAYQKAGGALRTDLFAAEENFGYILNFDLLAKLADEKFARKSAQLIKDGAAWVEIIPSANWQDYEKFDSVDTIRVELSPEDEQELTALNEQHDAAQEGYQNAESDTDEEQGFIDEMDKLQERIDELENKQNVPNPEEMALAGIVISLDESGKIKLREGLLKKEDKKSLKKQSSSSGNAAAEKEKSIYSEKLMRNLTAHRTMALREEIAANPDTALVMLAHTLVASVFRFKFYMVDNGIEISAKSECLKSHAENMLQSPAFIAMEAREESWAERLTNVKNGDDLFNWLQALPKNELIELLAYCTARTANTVQQQESKHSAAVFLTKAVSLNMAKWWTATKESFFEFIQKPVIVQIVGEVSTMDEAIKLNSMKKSDAAGHAENAVAGKDWLPTLFRPAEEIVSIDDAQETEEEAEEEAA